MRKFIAGVGLALFVASAAGGTAFAGEVTGNGKPTQGPAHAHSICAFSGLEDGSEDPTAPSGPGTTQNWGQIPHDVRKTLPAEEHPGSACNGHSGFLAQGGPTP